MAVETQTKYVCDGCDTKTERRDLVRFRIVEQDLDNRDKAAAKFELCTTCEAKLHELLVQLMPEREYAKIEGITR